MILKLLLRRDSRLYVGCIQTEHMDLIHPQALVISWKGFRLCDLTYNIQSIGGIQGNHTKISCLFKFILVSSLEVERKNRVIDSSSSQKNSLFWEIDINICYSYTFF